MKTRRDDRNKETLNLYRGLLLRLVLLGEKGSGGAVIIADASCLPAAVVARGIRVIQLQRHGTDLLRFVIPSSNYGKIKKDSNFQNDIVSSFFRAAL